MTSCLLELTLIAVGSYYGEERDIKLNEEFINREKNNFQ